MTDAVQAFVSAVVYVRNDEAGIYGFLKWLGPALEERFFQVEVVCVDDASADGSADEIRRAAAELPGVTLTIIHMGYHHGREAAMRAGDDLAIGDYVFEFDRAVPEFPLSALDEAFKTMMEGYDIVGVAPRGRRRFTSKLFYKVINHSAGVANDLDTETFRILSRRALNRIQSTSQAFPYRKALYANSGLPQATVSYEICDGGGSERKTGCGGWSIPVAHCCGCPGPVHADRL